MDSQTSQSPPNLSSQMLSNVKSRFNVLLTNPLHSTISIIEMKKAMVDIMKIKHLVLDAISNGDLGAIDDNGIVITLKDLEQTFPNINTQYINAFLPKATLTQGEKQITQSKFLYRIREDAYRVHPDAVEEHINNEQLADIEIDQTKHIN